MVRLGAGAAAAAAAAADYCKAQGMDIAKLALHFAVK
jgi:hypothetical protein